MKHGAFVSTPKQVAVLFVVGLGLKFVTGACDLIACIRRQNLYLSAMADFFIFSNVV